MRLAGAKAKQRAALNTAAGVQLVFKERRQAFKTSTSSTAGPLGHTQFSSSASSVRVSGISGRTLTLQDTRKPPAPARLAKIYRRHPNPERALSMFLLRRLQWRRSRRPSATLAFLQHLRRLRPRAPPSKEESAPVLKPATTQTTPLEPVAATKAAVEVPERPVGSDKRKKATTEIEETNSEARPPAKKVKVLTTTMLTAVSSNVVMEAGGNEKTEPRGNQPVIKKAVNHSVGKAVPPTAESSKTAPPTTEISKAIPFTAESSKASRDLPLRKKPTSKMEFFEQRVHEMVTDPLEFDDFVYESNRPPPRHTARMFARCRARQSHPPPPLVMSGAIGSPGGLKLASPVSSRKEYRSPSKESKQQSRGPGAGRGRKGKGVGSLYSDDESMRSVGSKSPGVRDGGVGKGKGKGKERPWLSNARSKHGGKQSGQQHPHRAYTSTR